MARANILASRQRRLNFKKAFMPGRGQLPPDILARRGQLHLHIHANDCISLYAKSLTAIRYTRGTPDDRWF